VKIIFLDIDGVLNKVDTPGVPYTEPDELLLIPIDATCMARLNRLVVETGAKIVISSSWRKFTRWEDLWPALATYGLVAEIVGETPDLINDPVWLDRHRTRDGAPFMYEMLERGMEIWEWLKDHPEVTEFVILDDCSDMWRLKGNLVLTDPIDGLDDPDVERAKYLMSRSGRALEVIRKEAFK
jgi:hypothetical protein